MFGHRHGRAWWLLVLFVIPVIAGCGSSSNAGVQAPVVGAAKTFQLGGFQPAAAVHAGKPTTVSFVIRQPNGQPLTQYKRGSGPHTGIHLIIVRSDLSTIIHKHPPVSADGHISQTVTFPTPGRYRVIVDAYPNLTGTQPNFQLFRWITVPGTYKPQKLGGFHSTVTTGGYKFQIAHLPKLKALQPAFINIKVTNPSGGKAVFQPWYGALAHAIFFRAGSLDYFHTHVCGAAAPNCTSAIGGSRISGTSTTPGNLRVGVLVPVPGTWRLFLQTQSGGKILTAPFTLKVG